LGPTPQPGYQRRGEQRRRDFQSDHQQQSGGTGSINNVRRRSPTVGVSGTARSQQQDGMEDDHGQGRNRDLMERPDAAVAPDVHRARDADRGKGNHENAEPSVMVTRCSEPQVHQAGESRQGCADPGVEDRSG
jgi:hypothetical protein